MSVQQKEKKPAATTTATNSHFTTTNESSWSLLHQTIHTPSLSTRPNTTTPTFFSDSSCASVSLPSPPGSSGSGGSGGISGRPSNHPIMGTSLYSAATTSNVAMLRSCTFPNGHHEVISRVTRPTQPFHNPIYTSGRTLVSVETQTSREQVTELDEFVENGREHKSQSGIHGSSRQHLYINILDEQLGAESVKFPG